MSDMVIHFSKSLPDDLLGCKRKIFGDSTRNLLLNWKVNCANMETRGDIWVSHVRCSYLQKDANNLHGISGMASYNNGMSVDVNTVLTFLFVLEISPNVRSTPVYSVLFEVAQIIYSVEYNTWNRCSSSKLETLQWMYSVECSEIKPGKGISFVIKQGYFISPSYSHKILLSREIHSMDWYSIDRYNLNSCS